MNYKPRRIKQVEFTPVQPGNFTEPLATLEDWWYYIRRYFLYNVRYWHKELKWGIRNLIYWFPIIWRDRDWDYRYMYDMLLHKLKQMEKGLEVSRSGKPEYDALKRCILILEEVGRRDSCDCKHLMDNTCSVEQSMECIKLQRDLMAEFGKQFARWNNYWWD